MKTLVYDEKQVERFLDEILYNPNFGSADKKQIELENQVFCMCFTARTKYLDGRESYNLKNNEQFYKAFIRHKDRFLRKLYERNLDTVFDRDGKQLPIECMAVYITINPRDTYQALFKLQKYCLDIAYRNDTATMKRLDSLAFKSYHTSPLKLDRVVIDFDITEKNPKSESRMLDLLNPIANCLSCIVETRGGFHVYLDISKAEPHDKKYIFQDLRKIQSEDFKEIQVQTDAMVVIPGTLQGGFKVRFRDDLI